MSNLLEDICKELESASILSKESQVFGYVDSGSHALNKVISGDYNGGYPIGSITEIYGESSSAKTVFLTHAFIGAQRDGYYTVMVDNEHAYSPAFAETLGLDASKLIYAEPECLEDCFEFIEKSILAIRKKDADTPIKGLVFRFLIPIDISFYTFVVWDFRGVIMPFFYFRNRSLCFLRLSRLHL